MGIIKDIIAFVPVFILAVLVLIAGYLKQAVSELQEMNGKKKKGGYGQR